MENQHKMQTQVNIRDAIRQDVPRLVQFSFRMAKETENRQLDDRVLNSGVNAVFDDPKRGFYLVAEVEGQVVGSLMVTAEWSDWRKGAIRWIQRGYVEAKFRHRGVFRAMYGEVRRKAKSTARVCGCRLYVEQDNAAAQVTYTRLGLVETNYKVFEENFQ